MVSATVSCLLSTRGGVASSSAAAAARPAATRRGRFHQASAAASVIVPSSSSPSRLVSARAEPLGSKENVQPFDEGAAQVQRLLKRDRLELLGEGDSLEDFISASEFADDDGDQGAPAPSSSSSSSSSAPASASASASAPIPKAAAVPVSPFGATPTSPFGGNAPGNKNAAGVDSASLGGGLRGSVFGSGGAAGSPFAAGGMPTSQGASGLYNEAERMPGEMNRGLFGEGDESFNISRNAKDEGEDFSKLPWWSGITLSQVVIAGSFLFTISLMLATAWFVNSVGAIRFNE